MTVEIENRIYVLEVKEDMLFVCVLDWLNTAHRILEKDSVCVVSAVCCGW